MAAVIEGDRTPRLQRAILLGLGLVAVVAMAGALVLWADFGTAVFFDMVAAGIAYCFLAGARMAVAGMLYVVPGETTKPSSVGGPFRLLDHNGRVVTDATFKGRPFL